MSSNFSFSFNPFGSLGNLLANVLIGYLLGMWLSAGQGLISANLMQTNWTNIWTYYYIVLWPIPLLVWLFGILWYYIVGVSLVALALVIMIALAVTVGKMFARSKGA